MRSAIVGAALLGCVGVPPPADPAPDAGDPCVDVDGDGYLPGECDAVPAAEVDCGEGDAARHPGAFEICDDDVDQDCDGGDLSCADALAPNVASFDAAEIEVANGALVATWTAAEGFALAELATAAAPSINLLYTGPMEERLAAVHMFTDFFSWETAVTPSPVEIASGPAVTRFSVSWDANDGATSGMNGATIYTVFPDGRIHCDVDLEVLISPADNHLTTYVALEPELFTHADWTVDGSGPYEVASFDPQVELFDFFFNDQTGNRIGSSCAYHEGVGRAVGFGWSVPPSPAPRGPRASQSQLNDVEANHQLALQFDWHRSEAYPAASYRGEFAVVVGSTATPPCAGLEAAIAATHTPLALSAVEGAEIAIGGTGDDDGDGFNEGGGFWQVAVDDEAVAVTLGFSTLGSTRQPAPAAAIHLANAGPVDPIVELDGERLVRGGDYHLQRDGGDLFLFVARPLADSTLALSHLR
jgi:hypothetical protein